MAPSMEGLTVVAIVGNGKGLVAVAPLIYALRATL